VLHRARSWGHGVAHDVTVAAIGTTHPWNIAGVGRDIALGTELGARVVTAVAAVSAQDEKGVRALEPIPLTVLQAQLVALPWNAVRAVRVGALPTPEAVWAVAGALAAHPVPAVIDPVLRSSTGGALVGEGVLEAVRDEFFSLPHAILTPNLDEAAALLGYPIDSDGLDAAAKALRAGGARAILLKGGHLTGPPVDVLASDDGIERYESERIPGTMRGTGCTLAMALTVALARGDELAQAVRFARGIVRTKIAQALT
jgi:hydroxymethylpyrimidine/phosphomethylpyrimidine kinase